MRTAHLARDGNRDETLCGEPWEDWQDPTLVVTEADYEGLSYGAAAALRESDRQRRPAAGDPVRQCQACFRRALEAAPKIAP